MTLITAKAKVIFSPTGFETRIKRKERKVLFRSAAFGRTKMRRSIKKRKGVSQPGNPPHSHHGALRDKIRFSVDLPSGTFIVGPEIFKGKTQISKPLPEALDKGLRIRVRKSARQRRKSNTQATRAIRLRPRPFRGAALALALQKMTTLLKEIPL